MSATELSFQVQSRCIGRLHQTRIQTVGIAAIVPHSAPVAESLLTWAALGVIGEDGKRDSYLQITRWNIEDSQKPSVSSPRSQSPSGTHGRHYYTAATRYKRRIKNATVFLTFAAPDAP
jgi:hypothetical protein